MKQLFFPIFVSFLLLFSIPSRAQIPGMTDWETASDNGTEIRYRMHDRSINNGYALCEVEFSMSAARCALTQEVSITIYENDGTSTNGTQRYSTTFDPGPGSVGISNSDMTRIQIVSTGSTEPLYARVKVVGVLPADDFEIFTPDCITSIVTEDSYDPNEYSEIASPIADGTTHQGLLINNDVDYYVMTITPANRHLVVSMDYFDDYRSSSANLDLDLYLLNESLETLFSSHTGASSSTASITESIDEILDPGIYYMVVRPTPAESSRNFYEFRWDAYATPTYQIAGSISDELSNDISGVSMIGLPGDPLTNVDGYYSVSVEHGWSGTVTPTLAGYTFNPAFSTYTDLEEAHLSEDYTAILTNPVISGRIIDGDGAGVEGVTLSGFPDPVLSDADGYYSGTIYYNWAGDIMPIAEGLVFTPEIVVYPPVKVNIPDQDYVSAVGTVSISGTVNMEGSTDPLEGVTMTGSPGPVVTNSEGAFSFDILYGSSFTMTPELEGYSFNPAEIVFTNMDHSVTVPIAATLNTYFLNGTVETAGGSALGGVTMNGLPGNPVTDTFGIYRGEVDHGWSGTVNPTIRGYLIDPASVSYNSVAASASQDYTANPDIYIIDGHVLDGEGAAIVGVSMGGLPADPLTDADGYYTANVEFGVNITVTPTLDGYAFSPTSMDYSPVEDDETTDYTGTQDPYLTISESMLSLGQEAGSNSVVDISSNVDWTLICPETWIAFSQESGSGDASLTVTAISENISTEGRSAMVTVTDGLISQNFSVSQSGSDPFLEVSVLELSLASAAGASGSVGIVSNIAWSVSEAADWLSVSPASGSNDDVITISALTANVMVGSRSVMVTVTGGGISHAIEVSQSGSESRLEVSTLTARINYEAGSYINVNISSNVDWNVSRDMWWLLVSPSFGTGDGVITLLADLENPDTTERIAIVTIAGDTMVRQIVVTQAGAAPEPTGTGNLLDNSELMVYPNPPQADQIFVESDIKLDSEVLIKILDITGKVLYETQLPYLLPGEPVELDLTGYPGGPYLIHIRNSGVQQVFKIMKYKGK